MSFIFMKAQRWPADEWEIIISNSFWKEMLDQGPSHLQSMTKILLFQVSWQEELFDSDQNVSVPQYTD